MQLIWKAALVAASLALAACSTQSGSDEDAMASEAGSGAIEESSLVYFNQTIGDRVFFAYDRSDLDASAQATLRAQADWMRRFTGSTATVEGHADERGTREYNLALGARRSNAVRNQLVAEGVSSRTLRTISYGKERPIAPGSNEEAWRQNRNGTAKPSGPGA